MCLAIYKPKFQEFPERSVLTNAWNHNPHGAGLAIARKNGVEIIKGIMTLLDLFQVLENPELYYEDVVLHFRWSTSGKIIPELTHPFPVTKKNSDFRQMNFITEKAIIHNGVLFNPMLNTFSDTAIFSRYLALKPRISEKQIKKILGDDRLAMIHKDKIKLLGSWTKIDGLHYSNIYSLMPARGHMDAFNWGDSVTSINDYKDEHAYDPYALTEGECCPFCDSKEIEYIGVYTKTFECLECSTVFNDSDMLIDNFEKYQNVKGTLKKAK